jgi:hypothetical protein
VPPAVALMNFEQYENWYTLQDLLPNWDISQGFRNILLISPEGLAKQRTVGHARPNPTSYFIVNITCNCSKENRGQKCV